MNDFIKKLIDRNFTGNIYVKSSSVQGNKCSTDICNGITHFNEKKNVDIIIITRGGGSITDLWEFNNENIIKAIHNSKLPIGCGIGHEKDYTICDDVCDITASTPTSIAYSITSDKHLITNLHNNKDDILQIIDNKLELSERFSSKINL